MKIKQKLWSDKDHKEMFLFDTGNIRSPYISNIKIFKTNSIKTLTMKTKFR